MSKPSKANTEFQVRSLLRKQQILARSLEKAVIFRSDFAAEGAIFGPKQGNAMPRLGDGSRREMVGGVF